MITLLERTKVDWLLVRSIQWVRQGFQGVNAVTSTRVMMVRIETMQITWEGVWNWSVNFRDFLGLCAKFRLMFQFRVRTRSCAVMSSNIILNRLDRKYAILSWPQWHLCSPSLDNAKDQRGSFLTTGLRRFSLAWRILLDHRELCEAPGRIVESGGMRIAPGSCNWTHHSFPIFLILLHDTLPLLHFALVMLSCYSWNKFTHLPITI